MRNIKVKPGQSVLDIAVQEFGDVAAANAIANVNDISISLTPPGILYLPDDVAPNLPVLQRIKAAGISPASDISGSDLGGIGAMGIEIDFKVY